MILLDQLADSLNYIYENQTKNVAGIFGLDFNNFEIYKYSNETLHTDYRFRHALPFEKVDDPISLTIFLQQQWQHSITISVIYFAMIKLIQMIMTNRKPFDLRRPMFYWNATLAVFSIVACIRFGEDFFHGLIHYGFRTVLCYSVYPTDVAAFWAMMFAISKVVELGDTLFIVLRKRRLIFLHYYHHAAVLIYAVHSGAEHTAAGRYFIWMNLLAHSFMYTYYAVAAYGVKLPRFVSIFVTTVQTTQMLLGVGLSLMVYKIKKEGVACQQSFENLYLAFLIYLTFAILFIQFFINSYLRNAQKKTERQKVE